MAEGVRHPETGRLYKTHVRKNTAIGFSQCDECTRRAAAIAASRSQVELECNRRKLKKHQDEVKADRVELARIARLCKIDKRHVGVMIDAVDKQKFGIPTTERHSKNLSRLERIIQKITGVRMNNMYIVTHGYIIEQPHTYLHRYHGHRYNGSRGTK